MLEPSSNLKHWNLALSEMAASVVTEYGPISRVLSMNVPQCSLASALLAFASPKTGMSCSSILGCLSSIVARSLRKLLTLPCPTTRISCMAICGLCRLSSCSSDTKMVATEPGCFALTVAWRTPPNHKIISPTISPGNIRCTTPPLTTTSSSPVSRIPIQVPSSPSCRMVSPPSKRLTVRASASMSILSLKPRKYGEIAWTSMRSCSTSSRSRSPPSS
mmetsp:Transcript_6418/g.15450  ORF Transcript_6418/g.15450 Transcript_6418/m.15450 type:complete len:218 (+) Transcript_6418:2502-3155(+)